MRKIKQTFLVASVLWCATATAAYAVPVFDVAPPAATAPAFEADAGDLAILPVPTTAEDGDRESRKPRAPAEESPAALIPEPSSWAMLMVGAGVLLLPRRRRTDNVVR
ncbi:PEP-CTERM sorting domain-containing protein [Pseudoduganella flava]|uniref:PEP-CTERM sorting domain-containing protein n=1 Tax=Pseudoduganella flava TaxID=871742 RepID=A0ABX6FRV2_9BURK|nr:PEP-CTERM sorting domain-containing protein [Pseudoduganella flava]QGZ40095.1 PEP-CTERM sorting domain-containing protein [Pseudoduganella flava]